jgi:hypothetical protein
VNKNYILLNNQSTVNQIANPKLLKIIRKQVNPSQSTAMLDPPLLISKENLGA